jgi:hypothetical protein
MSSPAKPAPDAMVRLNRVEFFTDRQPNVPGIEKDSLPNREKVLLSRENLNSRLSSNKHFIIFRDQQKTTVYVAHPARPTEFECISFAAVLQWRDAT